MSCTILLGVSGRSKCNEAIIRNNGIEEIDDEEGRLTGQNLTFYTRYKNKKATNSSRESAAGSLQSFSNSNVGGADGEGDFPLLSEQEKRELVSLVNDNNIPMDFVLEMKEAFSLFDKVK